MIEKDLFNIVIKKYFLLPNFQSLIIFFNGICMTKIFFNLKMARFSNTVIISIQKVLRKINHY